MTLKAENRRCQQEQEHCAEGARNRVTQLGQVDRCDLRERNAAAVAAHRDRVAQDQTQQLVARHCHAALEHARVVQLGEAEHVAARHRHAAQEHTRVAQLGEAEHVAALECHAAHERDRHAQLGEAEQVAARHMLCFTQLPAFAITINKSQGKNFAWVGVDLRDSLFTHGQLYIAASRVTWPNNNHFCVTLPCKTRNKVYTEVLSHD